MFVCSSFNGTIGFFLYRPVLISICQRQADALLHVDKSIKMRTINGTKKSRDIYHRKKYAINRE
jgi:hypothetical protein